jgi:chloride channel protein, CIC family
VLLAVELLLFELRPRSVIPVAFAAATATGVRIAFAGPSPAFSMPNLLQPHGAALATYVVLGAIVGVVSVVVTRAVYAVEDAFEHLPIHWMWWPALGAVAVGVVGYFAPRTLGVGYDNIDHILSGDFTLQAMLVLGSLKFLSWCISLGSGTSGGTLAPLFTIGGALGGVLAVAAAAVAPHLGIDPRIGALVGMAAMFTGASRALLASVVFAFETTRQPLGLLPLLGGCSAAFLISCLFMRNTIMTEKIARRGVRVPGEYAADFLDQIQAGTAASRPVTSLGADEPLISVRSRILARAPGHAHQGFPVVDSQGQLVGVLTRRDLLDPEQPASKRVGELLRRPAAVAFEDSTLREAADHMVREGVGRLPVVSRDDHRKVIGILTRSDLLSAHRQRLEELDLAEQHLDLRAKLRRRNGNGVA